MNNLTRTYIPVSKSGYDPHRKRLPITRQCVEAIRIKRRQWRKYKFCKSDSNFMQDKGL